METFPLCAAADDERLTLTEHPTEPPARLRLDDRRRTRHEPLSG